MKYLVNCIMCFCLFYAIDTYEEEQGECRNENDQSDDIFYNSNVTLDECKSECSSTPGCNAVSFGTITTHYRATCYGTSGKATVRETDYWRCYSKSRL